MSRVFELSDEQYEVLRRAAEARGETAETLLTALVEELRDPYTQPRYYETDNFLRHLGASEEEIEELNQEIAEEEGREARSDPPHHLAAHRRP